MSMLVFLPNVKKYPKRYFFNIGQKRSKKPKQKILRTKDKTVRFTVRTFMEFRSIKAPHHHARHEISECKTNFILPYIQTQNPKF